MSAEILRRAAAAMRENAEAAAPGPWIVVYEERSHDGDLPICDDAGSYLCCSPDDGVRGGHELADAEHIASWHPVVALAVADWLDSAYARWEATENSLSARSVRAMSGGLNFPDPHALAVARAYLDVAPAEET